jgi:hypothetical protein
VESYNVRIDRFQCRFQHLRFLDFKRSGSRIVGNSQRIFPVKLADISLLDWKTHSKTAICQTQITTNWQTQSQPRIASSWQETEIKKI